MEDFLNCESHHFRNLGSPPLTGQVSSGDDETDDLLDGGAALRRGARLREGV